MCAEWAKCSACENIIGSSTPTACKLLLISVCKESISTPYVLVKPINNQMVKHSVVRLGLIQQVGMDKKNFFKLQGFFLAENEAAVVPEVVHMNCAFWLVITTDFLNRINS